MDSYAGSLDLWLYAGLCFTEPAICNKFHKIRFTQRISLIVVGIYHF
jgi:hypothetical protein